MDIEQGVIKSQPIVITMIMKNHQNHKTKKRGGGRSIVPIQSVKKRERNLNKKINELEQLTNTMKQNFEQELEIEKSRIRRELSEELN